MTGQYELKAISACSMAVKRSFYGQERLRQPRAEKSDKQWPLENFGGPEMEGKELEVVREVDVINSSLMTELSQNACGYHEAEMTQVLGSETKLLREEIARLKNEIVELKEENNYLTFRVEHFEELWSEYSGTVKR
jgi:hypothetical protein